MESEGKRKFYIIARPCLNTGIGAIIGGYVSHFLYALDNGMIPIVDLKHYKNQYFKDDREFKDNTWEYFFEQPCGYGLEDITENDEVVISKDKLQGPHEYEITVKSLPEDTLYFKDERLRNLLEQHKKFYKLNKETLEYVQKDYDRVIGEQTNILGVLCRGTDYYIKKTFREQIQPSPYEVIKKVKFFLKKHPEISKIYLATEDDNIYKIFKAEFGQMLLDNNQYRYSYKAEDENKYLAMIDCNRSNHSYKLALEYLASLYILSRCKYFVGGRCGGTRVAYIMQNSWQDLYIWNLGMYGKNGFFSKIFSYWYEYNRFAPHIVVSILGIKIKLKNCK